MRSLRTLAVIFTAMGLPFGLLTGLAVGLFERSAGAGVAVGVGAGICFGGIVALAVGGIDALADRAPPGTRRGPRQDVTVPVSAGTNLAGRIVSALQSLPAEIHEADVIAGRYRARTRWSWKSFGEEVSVQLTGDPSAPQAFVSSRPVVPTTLVDYGKGRSNVATVAAALRS